METKQRPGGTTPVVGLDVVMHCNQARQLFDAYLDGELSPALATELGAHRLSCAECRRVLALMEVTGHILASDSDPVSLSERFPDRLLACMDEPKPRWPVRLRRSLYVAGPLLAAAVIALAFLGLFDRDSGEVAGQKAGWHEPVFVGDHALVADEADDPATSELDRWGRQLQENLEAKRHSVELLKKARDVTVLQLLDILEKARDTSTHEDHFPGADTLPEPADQEAIPVNGDDVD